MGDLVPVDRRPPEPRPANPPKIRGVGEDRLATELLGCFCRVGRRHLDILHQEPEPAWRQPTTQLGEELRREVEKVASVPGVPVTVAYP